jgi:hypothetical protein
MTERYGWEERVKREGKTGYFGDGPLQTASTVIPRGAQVGDRREMAFIANMNTLVRPYKEQRATAFFHGTLRDANGQQRPPAQGSTARGGESRGTCGGSMAEGGHSVRLPSRPFEECPEAWHVYAVQCFLSGDQVLPTLGPISIHAMCAISPPSN